MRKLMLFGLFFAGMTILLYGQEEKKETKKWVWIEAEIVKETSFRPNDWMKGDDPEKLSGGDALTHLSSDGQDPNRDEYYAIWEFEVPEDGTYEFWSREGHKGHIKYKWRIDKGEWQTSEYDLPYKNVISIGQFRTIGWVNNGKVEIKKGKHKLEIVLTGSTSGGTGKDIWGLFDCFLFTQERFQPRGKAKPGEE
ncbi:MAG TPA: hypothetical protein PKV21_05490 [bacterium]|nr:hypothetical protein [bacterium]